MIGAKEAIPYDKDFNLQLLFSLLGRIGLAYHSNSSRILKSLCGVFFIIMNKQYVLNKNPVIRRYVVFLCGAYYRDKPFDKRKILINYINHIAGNRITPIFVDEFLSEENIETASFTIGEYEELIASVSFANFIYLESFSSAAELGLFSHRLSSNNNIVFYPDSSNLILDKIGYFIKRGVFDDTRKIHAIPYLALVERFAHGTDFIDEHYYFVKNELPNDIKSVVEKVIDKIVSQKTELQIKNISEIPDSLEFYELAIDAERKKVYLSPKTAFYIVYALLFSKEDFDDVVALDTSKELDCYCHAMKGTILNTIIFNDYGKGTDFLIKVLNFKTLDDFVCCALFFIKYMSKTFALNNYRRIILLKPKDLFTEISYKEKELDLIVFPRDLVGVRKTKCIRRFTIYKRHKARNIIAYDDTNGALLRKIHEDISNDLHRICDKFGIYSSCSFAYKKGISTLDCVRKHTKSLHFLKLDIHHFFETMSFDLLEEMFLRLFENAKGYLMMSLEERKKFVRKVHLYLDVLTINKKFPIGFVTSPIISELYLSVFDRKLFNFCETMGVVYTRYADDLLFSSSEGFNFDIIENEVKTELAYLGLTINEKKTQRKSLIKPGDSINYIGLNLVYDGTETIISVGKKYIKKLAILKAYGYKDEYTLKKIEGLESYLRYNDSNGFRKYQKLLDIYRYKKKQ